MKEDEQEEEIGVCGEDAGAHRLTRPCLADAGNFVACAVGRPGVGHGVAVVQGLTLLHVSAQLERFLWNRGCA